MKYDLNRKVGTESQRTYQLFCKNGFFKKYMSGYGLEIGVNGYDGNTNTILPDCLGIDLDTPGYNGVDIPKEDNTFDWVYSSHMLEHARTNNLLKTIQEWHRVVKVGGHIVTIVPHKYAYEKKNHLPSMFNGDHQRFYTPSSLLNEFEQALLPNSYRVISLKDNVNPDLYLYPPPKHSNGPYEIILVIQKIEKPKWELV